MRRLAYNFLIALLLCSLTSVFALSKFDYTLTGIDDANIYFVYGRNLANGHGFVYNLGGERVEGFTSLLWTLISAAAFRLSQSPELFLLIVNIVILSLGLAAVLSYLQTDFFSAEKSDRTKMLWSDVLLLILITSPRYMIWNTITLMENSSWTTLLLLTSLLVIRDPNSAKPIHFGLIPLLAALLLTRPESMLWIPIFLGILFLRFTATANARSAFRLLLPSIIATGAALAILTMFRLQYFGYPLPNTYYAKVSPSLAYNLEEGAIYLFKYVSSDPIDFLSVSLVFASALQILYKVLSTRQIPRDGKAYLPLISSAGFLMPLITGGDHFGSFRFYQNIYPITVLSLVYIFDRLILPTVATLTTPFPQRLKSALQVIALLTAGMALFWSQTHTWNHLKAEIDTEFQVASYERKNGALIQELFSSLPDLPSIGVIAAGGIKYHYEGEIVDLMGLNNTVMAHNQGNRTGYKNHAAFEVRTFFRLEPDIVWPREIYESTWHYDRTQVMDGWENKEGFKGLFNYADFQRLYTFAKVGPARGDKYALVAWFKKDLLKALKTNHNFLVEEFQTIP